MSCGTKTTTTNLGFTGERKDHPVWQCVKSCGAYCKLDKGPSFPSPEEIFDDPSDAQLHRSLIGPEGWWCIHFEKSTRSCSISSAYWDWKANEYESADQACQDFMLTCSGLSGDWLGEYISRFVGCWGDYTFSKGYDASNGGCRGLEMVEDPYRDEERFDSYYNSDKEMDVQCGNEHNPWFAGGFGFQYGFGQDYGTEEHKSPCSHSWEEMELHDKIFGHWPCLLRIDHETFLNQN